MLSFFYKNIILSALLSINISLTFAQTEYLAVVNPSNGAITKVDSIPGVTWIKIYYTSTYCENNGHYTFIAGDDPNGNPFYLFTVDAVSGTTISNPLFPNHTSFISLQYSASGNILYGITLNSSVASLVTVNTTNGTYSLIRNIPALSSVSKFIVDDLHNRFIIIGPDNIGDLTLMTMDMSSGNIISQVHTPRINNLLYNKLTNKFYAISNRNGIPPNNHYIFSISTVDPNTGVITNLTDIPNLAGFSPGSETLDEKNNLYFFAGFEWNGTAHYLYSVDLTTGNIINKPSIPVSDVIDKDNLIQFRFDNISQKLYALFWEAKTISLPPTIIDSACRLDLQTKIYPNPTSNILTVDKNSTVCKVKMNLYNMLGQLILKDKIITDGRNEIRLSNLSSGIYYYKFISDEHILLVGSIYKY